MGSTINNALSAWIPAFAGMTQENWILDKCSILVTLVSKHLLLPPSVGGTSGLNYNPSKYFNYSCGYNFLFSWPLILPMAENILKLPQMQEIFFCAWNGKGHCFCKNMQKSSTLLCISFHKSRTSFHIFCNSSPNEKHLTG